MRKTGQNRKSVVENGQGIFIHHHAHFFNSLNTFIYHNIIYLSTLPNILDWPRVVYLSHFVFG